MSGISIDAAQFKAVRRGRKFGRPKLAKLAGISERQIAKIEGNQDQDLSEEMLMRLCDVLQVPVPVLTGEVPPIEDDLQPISTKKCTTGCCG